MKKKRYSLSLSLTYSSIKFYPDYLSILPCIPVHDRTILGPHMRTQDCKSCLNCFKSGTHSRGYKRGWSYDNKRAGKLRVVLFQGGFNIWTGLLISLPLPATLNPLFQIFLVSWKLGFNHCQGRIQEFWLGGGRESWTTKNDLRAVLGIIRE